jgi:hypothetical protein
MPERNVGDDKGAAFKAYRARLREGLTHEEMRDGADAYFTHCERERITGTQFVMQGKTFFGPSRRWEAFLTPSI